MRAIPAVTAAVLASALALVGCSPTTPEPAETTGSAGGNSGSLTFSEAEIEELGGQENVDYMVNLYDEAVADGQTTITVYGITATSSASLYARFMERFPEMTVEHVTIFGVELQNRIASEQTTGQFVADNVSVGGADALFVKDNDYIVAQDPPLAEELPDEYKEGEGLFGANTYLYTVGYNTDLVDEADVPKTFDDLLDPKWAGKIAIGDVTTGAPGFIWNAIRAGKIDEDWLEDFAATNPVLLPSERDVFTAVSTGQVPLGLNNYIRGDAFLKTDNLPVGFVADFEDGISDGVFFRGTVKNAPNELASNLLVAWWLTPEAMELLSIQGQAGLMPDAPAVVGQPPLSEININPQASLDEYKEEQTEGTALFRRIFG